MFFYRYDMMSYKLKYDGFIWCGVFEETKKFIIQKYSIHFVKVQVMRINMIWLP
jgi:hypothetical protein